MTKFRVAMVALGAGGLFSVYGSHVQQAEEIARLRTEVAEVRILVEGRAEAEAGVAELRRDVAAIRAAIMGRVASDAERAARTDAAMRSNLEGLGQ